MNLVEEEVGQISILRTQISNPRLCIIETHGAIEGNKVDVAEYSHDLIEFCKKNEIIYIAYNPSNNGTQPDQPLEEVKFTKRVQDLVSVISYSENTYKCPIILIGSSLGALISINAASEKISNVTGLIINCGVVRPEETLKILAGDTFNTWQEKDSAKVLNVNLPYAFFEDIISLHTEEKLRNLNIPILWFHGTKDDLALTDTVRYATKNSDKISLIEVENGGHRFGEFMQPGEWENKVETFIKDLMSS